MQKRYDYTGKDVQDVQVSGRKISAHFQRIEQAQLDELPAQRDGTPTVAEGAADKVDGAGAPVIGGKT